MQNYKHAFLEFAITQGALKFGEFTLKSGRTSPYFFNTGLFNNGQSISKLGRFYAQAIIEHDFKFDTLFGPAYKGIPLAIATTIALAEQHGKNIPYAFNRKEIKSHGEKGQIVGGDITQKVLIIDDVITAGTAITEALQHITTEGGEAVGVMISLDRQERGYDTLSAIKDIESKHNIQVASIASLEDLLGFIHSKEDLRPHLPAIENYHAEYGITA